MEYIEHLSTTRLYPDGHEESGEAALVPKDSPRVPEYKLLR